MISERRWPISHRRVPTRHVLSSHLPSAVHNVSISRFPPPSALAMPPIAASPPNHDENAPLLASPSLEAGTTGPPTPSPPWQFWNRPPFRRVHFADHDQFVSPASAHSESEISVDGNGGYGTNPKYPRQPLQQEEKMGQWMMYCLLVLVGMVFGALFSRNWSIKGDAGDMPMVPPVWTLPPVRLVLPAADFMQTVTNNCLSPPVSLGTTRILSTPRPLPSLLKMSPVPISVFPSCKTRMVRLSMLPSLQLSVSVS